jgi:hypothetical protein
MGPHHKLVLLKELLQPIPHCSPPGFVELGSHYFVDDDVIPDLPP